MRRPLRLRAEILRVLTDLGGVVGGHPTSYQTFCWCAGVRRAATSETGGDTFPCPGDWTWTCKP